MIIDEKRAIIREYQNRVMGFIFETITPVTILFGLPTSQHNLPGWWHSVSETYYATDGIIMIGLLSIITLLSITHRSNNRLEKLLFFLCGISMLGILTFPHGLEEFEYAGVFMVSHYVSGKLHVIFATIMFITLGAISVLCFPKQLSDTLSEKKKTLTRRVYLANGISIFVFSLIIACRFIFNLYGWLVIICEFVIFTTFGVNLLIQSGFFKYLRD